LSCESNRPGITSQSEHIEAELVTKALKAGLKVTEVPVTRDRRASGSSGLKRIRHGTRILFRIVRERMTF
jgi:hypothetical protein